MWESHIVVVDGNLDDDPVIEGFDMNLGDMAEQLVACIYKRPELCRAKPVVLVIVTLRVMVVTLL